MKPSSCHPEEHASCHPEDPERSEGDEGSRSLRNTVRSLAALGMTSKSLGMTLAVAMSCLLFSAPAALGQNKDQSHRITSWTADRREYAVGDIITVLVSDVTLASATKSQSGTDQQTRKNDLGLEPPKIGESALPSIDASMSTNKNASSKQSGDAKRTVNFQGDISVRVTAVDKSGQLQIKGSKVVDVDKNKQTLNFSGWVRPEDISAQNFVASERVADVALTYSLSGNLGKTRGGIVGRLLNVFWP